MNTRDRDNYTIDGRLWQRGRNAMAAIAVAGWGGCAVALRLDPVRFHASYLVAYAFFLTLAYISLALFTKTHANNAAKTTTFRASPSTSRF